MDKTLARKLVKETLQNPFDKERFTRLVKEICKKPDASKAFQPIQGAYLPEIFRPYIKNYERIATYTDPEGKKTDILIVKLQRESSLERARTAQRNFIARYLKDRDAKDAAIVAFVSPDDSDWRFSFVKMEYKLAAGDKGKLKVEQELTPARRYSFLVGAQENSHTAQSRLLDLLSDDTHLPLLAELEDAFSIEKVTKEFFDKYRELYLKVSEALDKLVADKNNTKIRAEFEKQGVETADFAKKLLGQIVFLYFLQKKGWFGVGRDEDWGTGPKNFLRKLFNQEVADYKNFFNDILEPLFYEALARERDSNFYNQFNCKIPFLNGGLFDPINNYDWVHTDITLPNDLFSNDYKTSEGDPGTGILDVFDRYNFTVKEDEPLEKEVAIDPEMLGKVFENLLEVKDRKSKGTYYTPREIVHYMCQQGLVYYLSNELDGKVSKDEAETFIKYGESALENEARVAAKGKETDDYSYKLPPSIREHAELLDKKLADIKVCDPAVGSGAFLVGMMSEIVRARKTLNAYLGNADRTAYEFKHHAIHGSLYGVDIDPSAVEIAKLRLWLSLVVDEDDIKHVKPLPNLDYKIMQGNSLLEEYEGIKLFDEKFILGAESGKEQAAQLKEQERDIQQNYIRLHGEGKLTREKQAELDGELKRIKSALKKLESGKPEPEGPMMFAEMNVARRKVEELQKLHLQFFESSQKSQKDKIRKQIEALEWELIEATLKENGKTEALKTLAKYRQTNTKPFFLWKLHFSDVFRDKKGFDVVIANPPYISHDKILDKAEFRRNFRSFEAFADVYCYFIELAIRLAASNGNLCYITSNSYLRADYGKHLRNLLSMNCQLKTIINIEDFQIFDTAIVNTAVLLAQKTPNKTSDCLIVNAILPGNVHFADFVDDNKFYYSQSDFSEKSWTLNSPEFNALQAKIEQSGKTLEALHTKIRLGLATGANDVFVIDHETRNRLLKENPTNKQIIKPVLRGRDISRYSYNTPNHYILLTKNGIDVKNEYPGIYQYLESFGDTFKQRGAQGQHWTNLRACAFFDDFKREKIIWIELTDKGRFALSSEEIYLLNSAYFLLPPGTMSSKYLLAILNSRVIEFYLHLISETSGMGTCRWINNYVKEFPIPEIPEKQQKQVESLVDKVLQAKSKDPDADISALETQIDQLVYKLYNLTPSEIAIVEGKI